MQTTQQRPQIDKHKIARWIEFTHELSHREFRIALGLVVKGLSKESELASQWFGEILTSCIRELRQHEGTNDDIN